MAHLEVTAGSGRVLAGSVGAADLLNLLAEALQGAVHLQIAVTENIGIISTEQTVGIRCLLLWLGNEAEVKSATRGTRRSRGSGRSRRSLFVERKKKHKRDRRSYLKHRTVPNSTRWYQRFDRLTAGPISPERPRGPGGPVGPGRPDIPSLPGEPADPDGPCRQHGEKPSIVPDQTFYIKNHLEVTPINVL